MDCFKVERMVITDVVHDKIQNFVFELYQPFY